MLEPAFQTQSLTRFNLHPNPSLLRTNLNSGYLKSLTQKSITNIIANFFTLSNGQVMKALMKKFPGYLLPNLDVVGCSYVDCWEVVVNQPACIKLLLLSRYVGRTFDSMRAFLTEVWIASCKTMYSDANKTQDVQFGQCLFLRLM